MTGRAHLRTYRMLLGCIVWLTCTESVVVACGSSRNKFGQTTTLKTRGLGSPHKKSIAVVVRTQSIIILCIYIYVYIYIPMFSHIYDSGAFSPSLFLFLFVQ